MKALRYVHIECRLFNQLSKGINCYITVYTLCKLRNDTRKSVYILYCFILLDLFWNQVFVEYFDAGWNYLCIF